MLVAAVVMLVVVLWLAWPEPGPREPMNRDVLRALRSRRPSNTNNTSANKEAGQARVTPRES